MRLHELTPEQIEAWRKRRAEVGRQKYGDAHLQRYGLADVMEEVLDAVNIMGLFLERLEGAGFEVVGELEKSKHGADVYDVYYHLRALVDRIASIDSRVPDHLCTDERGGERIWWSEQAGERRAG